MQDERISPDRSVYRSVNPALQEAGSVQAEHTFVGSSNGRDLTGAKPAHAASIVMANDHDGAWGYIECRPPGAGQILLVDDADACPSYRGRALLA